MLKNPVLSVDEFKSIYTSKPDLSVIARRLRHPSPNLLRHSHNENIENTKATAHTYYVACDGDGRPKTLALAKELAKNIVEYAIPRSKFLEAKQIEIETNSSSEIYNLYIEANNLFTTLDKSGEGGEILLYWFAEKILKLPQIISKMSLKTSPEMHFHGSDGVHAGVDTDGLLELYYCESKIHASMSKAITECIKSIAPMLLEPYGIASPNENDVRLLNNYIDTGNTELEIALKEYLNPTHPNFNRVKSCAICLVGCDLDEYNCTNDCEIEITQLIKQAIDKYHQSWLSHTQKKIIESKLKRFTMHILYVPFPSVDDFRQSFKAALHIG